MKIIKLFFAIGCVLLLFASCCKKEPIVTFTNDYMPLEVGNYWQMNHAEKQEIVGEIAIFNKNYSILKQGTFSSYWRIENDRVFESDSVGNETVIYNLAASVNSSWKSGDWIITLKSKNDTVTINGKHYPNCFKFYFDIPQAADEEHFVWLAPKIGYIQKECGFCLNPISYLEKARIKGQETVY